MKSTVVLLRCPTYDRDLIEEKVRFGIDLLGGFSSIFTSGEQILLKPNLLFGQSADRCITTHPAIFEAVIRVFQTQGIRLSFGDSPGYEKPITAAKKAGLQQIAEKYQVPFADFESSQLREATIGNTPVQIPIAEGALSVDGIVSLPKFKTHGLTRITGAVKNQLGCVPGFPKAEFHVRFPHIDTFSSLLAMITRILSPRLFIMDGIMAMEGEGPGSGDPVKMECLILSKDPVALDATVCRLIDLNPEFVPTIQAGEKIGLGTGKMEAIELVGDPLETLKRPSFHVKRFPPTPDVTFPVLRPLRNLLLPQPRINPLHCTLCGICVKACPVSGKALTFVDGKGTPPRFIYASCIRCFCCHEMCPHRAITIRTPILGRFLLGILGKGTPSTQKK